MWLSPYHLLEIAWGNATLFVFKRTFTAERISVISRFTASEDGEVEPKIFGVLTGAFTHYSCASRK